MEGFLFYMVKESKVSRLWLTYGIQRLESLTPDNNVEVRMLDKLGEIEKSALESLSTIKDQAALEAWRVANVGRSSPLMQVFSELGKLSKEERPAVGAAANRVKVTLETALTDRSEEQTSELQSRG